MHALHRVGFVLPPLLLPGRMVAVEDKSELFRVHLPDFMADVLHHPSHGQACDEAASGRSLGEQRRLAKIPIRVARPPTTRTQCISSKVHWPRPQPSSRTGSFRPRSHLPFRDSRQSCTDQTAVRRRVQHSATRLDLLLPPQKTSPTVQAAGDPWSTCGRTCPHSASISHRRTGCLSCTVQHQQVYHSTDPQNVSTPQHPLLHPAFASADSETETRRLRSYDNTALQSSSRTASYWKTQIRNSPISRLSILPLPLHSMFRRATFHPGSHGVAVTSY